MKKLREPNGTKRRVRRPEHEWTRTPSWMRENQYQYFHEEFVKLRSFEDDMERYRREREWLMYTYDHKIAKEPWHYINAGALS